MSASMPIDDSKEIRPIDPPPLGIPPSNNIVRVQAIDTTTNLWCDAPAFVRPIIRGHESLNLTTMCFLLENKSKDQFVLFDCGARKDFWIGPPSTKKMIGGHTAGLKIEKSVDEILVDAGFDLEKLNAIVWSHWHWDHTGDSAKFPTSTDIVVGEGFTAAGYGVGYPTNPNGAVLETCLEERKLREISFRDDFRIGDFRAHDYFGDGSFYLLDVPGHAVGHVCGLARTTPTTFVLLGGDCCHFPGVFRPTAYAPLPYTIPSSVLDDFYPNPCPCSMFTQYHPLHDGSDMLDSKARTNPYYQVSREKENVYTDPELAERSIDSLQPFDASPNILICLAHDPALFEAVPRLNIDPQLDINDWKEKGYKEISKWGFLNELPKNGKPGRSPLVQGVNNGGKKLKLGPDLIFRELTTV